MTPATTTTRMRRPSLNQIMDINEFHQSHPMVTKSSTSSTSSTRRSSNGSFTSTSDVSAISNNKNNNKTRTSGRKVRFRGSEVHEIEPVPPHLCEFVYYSSHDIRQLREEEMMALREAMEYAQRHPQAPLYETDDFTWRGYECFQHHQQYYINQNSTSQQNVATAKTKLHTQYVLQEWMRQRQMGYHDALQLRQVSKASSRRDRSEAMRLAVQDAFQAHSSFGSVKHVLRKRPFLVTSVLWEKLLPMNRPQACC